MPIPARTRRRDDRAAVAVEFALIAPLLLLLLAGIIQYGLYFWAMQAGTNAAADAARQLSVGDCQSSSQIQSYVSSRVGSAASSSTAVSAAVTYTPAPDSPSTDVAGSTAPGEVGGDVSVSVSFQAIDLHLPLVPVPRGGLVSRTSDARIEDTTAGDC